MREWNMKRYNIYSLVYYAVNKQGHMTMCTNLRDIAN